MQTWTAARLRRLFDRYNSKFWNCRLQNWEVTFSESCPGLMGHCDDETKRISIRLSVHTNDRGVRATLVHEMAHAATSGDHDEVWLSEMLRLKKAGAPTEPLDFLVPYEARSIVTSFMEYATNGVGWDEALDELGVGLDAVVLAQCKRFFTIEKRKKRL